MHIVADNLTVTNTVVANALQQRDPQPIRKLVRSCEAAGAGMIDINSGPLTRNPEESMVFLVDSVRAATNLPLLLDTSNPAALEAGLQACGGRAIINGFPWNRTNSSLSCPWPGDSTPGSSAISSIPTAMFRPTAPSG